MKKTIGTWIWETIDEYHFHGPGVKTAFESGVHDRIRGISREENQYQRADCQRAWVLGWDEVDAALRKGDITLVCDYCGQEIPDRGVEK